MEREEVYQICQEVLSYSRTDEAEILFEEERQALIRLANNQIEQNINTDNRKISIRSISGKKVGRAWTNIFDKESLKKMVRASEEISSIAPVDEELLPLPGPQDYREINSFIEATAKSSPEEKTEILRDILAQCRNVTAAGVLSTSCHTVAIANTKGLFAYNQSTESILRLTIMTEDSFGFCQDLNKDINKLDRDKVIDVAMEKALLGRQAKEIPPGEYTVILEPKAVADLVILLAQLAFGGLIYQEGRSFLSGRLGQKLFDEKINLSDDVYHELSYGLPFDFEGIPREKVVLIANGIACNVVHSRKTANKSGVKSTGHALPEPNTTGPIPLNPVLSPGKDSLEEMIASTDKGILISQFHYTNVINPMELTLTGMTRNGTFMIEDGKISYAVKNMRFTDSLIRIFNEVEAVGRELIRTDGFFGGMSVTPSLKIKRFNFSSATIF